jgi:hypothetical protein
VGRTRIGLDRRAVRLAVGGGAAWVASGDGSLARIDPSTNAVRFLPVAHGLKDVTVRRTHRLGDGRQRPERAQPRARG